MIHQLFAVIASKKYLISQCLYEFEWVSGHVHSDFLIQAIQSNPVAVLSHVHNDFLIQAIQSNLMAVLSHVHYDFLIQAIQSNLMAVLSHVHKI